MSRCSARQRNRYVPDFGCGIDAEIPHSVHVDPDIGMRWGHPGRKSKGGYPYGIRKPRDKNSGHTTKTRPGVYYSPAPARH